MLVRGLVESGITVISGLAYGIDTEAHKTAVNAGGRTIAVLGCGVDIVYPAENRKLGQAIIENGAIVSEYPLGTTGRYSRKHTPSTGVENSEVLELPLGSLSLVVAVTFGPSILPLHVQAPVTGSTTAV